MKNLNWLIGLIIIFVLQGCASNDRILRMRSLATPSNPQTSSETVGEFHGLHELTKTSNNTNLLFVHGIGWTQKEQTESSSKSSRQIEKELVDMLVSTYGAKLSKPTNNFCSTSNLDGAKGDPNTNAGGLKIVSSKSLSPFSTDDPYLKPSSTELGCLDKNVIEIGEGKTISIYRFLWDDAMWNAFEWMHVGYDDPLPKSNGKVDPQPGYDDPDSLRAADNSDLKNSVVTYGLTDAALYIGPAGALMREGVEAAMCAAISDFTPQDYLARNSVSAVELCGKKSAKKQSFAVMSHSLGSRIVFDVLKTDLTNTLAKVISEGVLNNDVEIYMLANQIPLVGVGRMDSKRVDTKLTGKSLKFIAVSEINDLLTYELVPYFEHMYYLRCYSTFQNLEERKLAGCVGTAESEYSSRRKEFYKDGAQRADLVKDLGFDVVDVRAEFAPRKIALYDKLIDPAIAHSGHFGSKAVSNLIMCGAKNGRSVMATKECVLK